MTSWPEIVLPYIRVKHSAFFDEAKWTNYTLDFSSDGYEIVKNIAYMDGTKGREKKQLTDSQCEEVMGMVDSLIIPTPIARHFIDVCDGSEYELVIRAPGQEVHCKWCTGSPEAWGSVDFFATYIMSLADGMEAFRADL